MRTRAWPGGCVRGDELLDERALPYDHDAVAPGAAALAAGAQLHAGRGRTRGSSECARGIGSRSCSCAMTGGYRPRSGPDPPPLAVTARVKPRQLGGQELVGAARVPQYGQ
jgi:hypothetical protein